MRTVRTASRSKPVFRLPEAFLFLLLLMLPMMLLLGAAAARGGGPTLLFWLVLIIPLVALPVLLFCCEPEETADAPREAARGVNSVRGVSGLRSVEGIQDAVREDRLAGLIAPFVRPLRSYADQGVEIVEGVPQVPAASLFRELERRLAPYGATPLVEELDHGVVRVVALPMEVNDRLRSRPSGVVNILLLAATLVTTTYAGALQQGVNLLAEPGRFAVGLPYAVTLLTILGVHELGHYFMARHHGVDVTPPYFIPVPLGLGTFGAFIQIKSLIKTRRAIFDIGIAGPLAGLVLAIPLLYIGLRGSVPLDVPQPGVAARTESSLLLAFMYQLVSGGEAGGVLLRLSPVAFAAWIGIFVTALNLLPVGQLDGGHIAYALLGRRYARMVSMGAVALMVAAGLVLWPGLLTWALLVALMAGFSHMPALDDVTPPDVKRLVLGAATLLLPLVVLLPTPR
jgi:membrane-associated protease RseP (regulator of RpoE activity)